jgi:copper chaperone CopZ
MEKKIELQIEGMSCGHCVSTVERLLSGFGIISSSVNLELQKASVIFDDAKTDAQKIIGLVNGSGIYQAVFLS